MPESNPTEPARKTYVSSTLKTVVAIMVTADKETKKKKKKLAEQLIEKEVYQPTIEIYSLSLLQVLTG